MLALGFARPGMVPAPCLLECALECYVSHMRAFITHTHTHIHTLLSHVHPVTHSYIHTLTTHHSHTHRHIPTGSISLPLSFTHFLNRLSPAEGHTHICRVSLWSGGSSEEHTHTHTHH